MSCQAPLGLRDSRRRPPGTARNPAGKT